jgi:uncharacterized protein
LRAKESPYIVHLREIPTSGLQRKFDLSGDFARSTLADTEASPESAHLAADLTLSKAGVEVIARGRVDGELDMVCSRCVGPARVTIAAPFQILFLPRDADVPDASDDEIADDEPDVIAYDEEKIDLEETLREELLLALPYAPLCSEACKGLCATCGKDLNDGPCDCPDGSQPSTDDRLAPLKNLKF